MWVGRLVCKRVFYWVFFFWNREEGRVFASLYVSISNVDCFCTEFSGFHRGGGQVLLLSIYSCWNSFVEGRTRRTDLSDQNQADKINHLGLRTAVLETPRQCLWLSTRYLYFGVRAMNEYDQEKGTARCRSHFKSFRPSKSKKNRNEKAKIKAKNRKAKKGSTGKSTLRQPGLSLMFRSLPKIQV